MANMTGTTLATYLQEVWSTAASVIYAADVVIEPLVNHRWEPETGVGRGDTVNVPEFTQSTSANKRSTFGTGAALTLTATTESQKQILINQMAYLAFQLPVEMSLQILSVYIPLLIEDIGIGIGNQVDSELAGDNTNGFDAATAVGSDNEPITEDIILDAEAVLNTSRARMDGRYFVISPNTRADMLQIEVLRNQLNAATMGGLGKDKGQGFQGSVVSLDVHLSNNLEAGTNGTKCFIGQTEYSAFAGQNGVSVAQDLEITEGLYSVVAGWRAYGFLLMKGNHGREVDAR